jgi:transcriptional repressor NrdR
MSNSLRREFTSKEIGEMAMDRLKKLDEVAYVRFASVYRRFQDVDTFRNELNKLLGGK